MSSDTHLSRQLADRLPFRALKFLRAAGTSRRIGCALAAAGYTRSDHEQGWRLLEAVSGRGARLEVIPSHTTAGHAIEELDSLDESLLRRVEAGLRHAHPAQADYVFGGLRPAVGTEAVVSVAVLLSRLDALERDPAREATRAEDQAALAVLAARGFGPEARARLEARVRDAQRIALEDSTVGMLDVSPDAEGLRALHGWVRRWSVVARTSIKRRDFLVRLGLATRQPQKRPSPPPPATAAADPR